MKYCEKWRPINFVSGLFLDPLEGETEFPLNNDNTV